MPAHTPSAASSWLNTGYLLCSFTLWLYWSVITVQMLNLGFDFSVTELYSLLAIAGLSGAVLQIPAGYFTALFGCRNATLITTLLLLLPCGGAAIALQYPALPLWCFQLLALLSGLGGANIMVALTNSREITPHHPLAAQEQVLGLGQLGISLAQLAGPLLMGIALFAIFGEPQILQQSSGNLLTTIQAGQLLWLHNASSFWGIVLLLLAIVIAVKLKNPLQQTPTPSFSYSLCWIMLLLALSILPVAAGLWLLLTDHFSLSANLVLALILMTTLFVLRIIPGPLQPLLEQQYSALNSKHCWVICVLYAAIFGSLLGFSAAMPLTLKVIFGYSQLTASTLSLNANAPSALTYSWLLPFTAVLLYPSGSWLSVRWGSARVIQICLVFMLLAMLTAAWYLHQAASSTQPEQYFLPFLLCFIVVMAGSGLANSACLLLIYRVFPVSMRTSVLHNCMAVAALGAFYIPHLLSLYLAQHKPANALVNFAFFYLLCLFLNGFFYLRKKGEFYNP